MAYGPPQPVPYRRSTGQDPISPFVTGEDGGELARASTAALRFRCGNVSRNTSCGSSLGSFLGPSADCDRMVGSMLSVGSSNERKLGVWVAQLAQWVLGWRYLARELKWVAGWPGGSLWLAALP